MKLKLTIFTFLLFIFIGTSQNRKKDSICYLKSTLNLTNEQMKFLVSNDSIVKELNLIIKDSSKISKAKKRLNMFFEGKYDIKKLLISLELTRLLENGNFEFTDSLDSEKALHFKSAKEFQKLLKKTDSSLKLNVKVKDSTKKKQN